MSHISQQLSALKDDMKIGLPYIGLGLVGFAPAEIPSWGLLSGVVALGYLINKVKNYKELSPRNQMRRLNILCDHMELSDKGYEIDKEEADELGIQPITPYTLSEEEQEKTALAIRAMYLDKVAYYNISKNIKPMQAAYYALRDIWKDCGIQSDISLCFKKNDQEKMIALYELATLYAEIREYDTDEGILMHYNAVHESLHNEKSFPYDLVAPNLVQTDYLVNQSTHSLPVRKQIRAFLMGTIGLTTLAAAMTVVGLKQDGVVPERVRYVGGLAAIMLAAGWLRGRKYICEETSRFNNEEFIGDIIEHQKVNETNEATVFTSTVTRLSDAEKMRRELIFYTRYTDKLSNNTNVELKDIEANAHQDIKKRFQMYRLFSQGYNIEDGMRYLSIGPAIDEVVCMCLARYIEEDTINRASTQEHLDHIKAIQQDKEEALAWGQNEEKKKHLKPEQQLYLQPNLEDIPYISLKREVVVPHGLKIHPRVRELLTQYQNQ